MPDESEDALVITREPIVGIPLHEGERLVDEMLVIEAGTTAPLDLGAAHRRRWSGRGVRHFLSEDEGSGYWDFFKISDALLVSVTDAHYRKDTWIRVDGTGFFKLRLLLSGTIRSKSGEFLVQPPDAVLHIAPGVSSEGYHISSHEPVRMVVLHCRSELITHVLGIKPNEVPTPLNTLFSPGHGDERVAIRPGANVLHAVQLIVESRHQMRAALRGPYIEALSMGILMQIIGEFGIREMVRRASSSLRARDLNRIYEARDYLDQHFEKPPKIPELARLVGSNQTKLKAGFREVTKLTIYEYILRRRMERATELLRLGDFGVAEVAYEVGYTYPANFTYAFKKFYGKLPRALTQLKRARK